MSRHFGKALPDVVRRQNMPIAAARRLNENAVIVCFRRIVPVLRRCKGQTCIPLAGARASGLLRSSLPGSAGYKRIATFGLSGSRFRGMLTASVHRKLG
jgi:hypothetical protein